MKISRNCENKKLEKPFKSNRKFKKLQVCVKNREGDILNIHFGDKRYDDFLIHKDKNRRKNFRLRHRCDSDKPNKLTSRYWSCEVLW